MPMDMVEGQGWQMMIGMADTRNFMVDRSSVSTCLHNSASTSIMTGSIPGSHPRLDKHLLNSTTILGLNEEEGWMIQMYIQIHGMTGSSFRLEFPTECDHGPPRPPLSPGPRLYRPYTRNDCLPTKSVAEDHSVSEGVGRGL